VGEIVELLALCMAALLNVVLEIVANFHGCVPGSWSASPSQWVLLCLLPAVSNQFSRENWLVPEFLG